METLQLKIQSSISFLLSKLEIFVSFRSKFKFLDSLTVFESSIYDFENKHFYIANARGDGESGPNYSYDRQFIRFDMDSLFTESLSEQMENPIVQ